jgi:hypothetical protein
VLAPIICTKCGKETPRRKGANTQKYCPECSEIRDLERKRQWARDNYDPSKAPSEEARNIKRRADKDNGKALNESERRSIMWTFETDKEIEGIDRMVRISVPFTYHISKNAMWSTTRKGHVFLREYHKTIRDLIGYRLKQAIGEQRFYEDKIWLDIFVQKPDARGDALNVIDAVSDAIKGVLGVDDRWYSVKRLDWQIVKDDPQIYIGISQKSDGDKRICSYCGRILTLDMFWKDKSNRMGVGRECKECKTAKGRKKK